MIDLIKKWVQEGIDVKRLILNSAIPASLLEISDTICESFEKGGRLFLCGNGGSAADAQHIAAELSVRFKKERPSLPAIALGTNFSHITAAANDYDFTKVFSRQLEGLGQKGDILIALSTSGNSDNIIAAINAAEEIGMKSFALTGASGGKLLAITSKTIRIPSDNVPRIQECHILCGHILCELIEEKMFSDQN
jgi:D-sedoheptulose 7-phosphate isomerase